VHLQAQDISLLEIDKNTDKLQN